MPSLRWMGLKAPSISGPPSRIAGVRSVPLSVVAVTLRSIPARKRSASGVFAEMSTLRFRYSLTRGASGSARPHPIV